MPKVYNAQAYRLCWCEGFSNRKGRVSTAHTNANTPLTAIPTKRKGRSSSQTTGYKTRAINARGHEKTKRSSQSRKVIYKDT